MADRRTDELDAASALAGTEPVPVYQGGTTKRSTPAALLAYIRALLTDTDVPAGITTESGTSRAMANADAGRYIRFTSGSAKTATFGTGVNVVGQEFHIRNVGANNLTLTPSSTTLNAPAGGTLVVPPGGTVTVKQVASTEFDVFGQTTAA
jgi:hypothetical protein